MVTKGKYWSHDEYVMAFSFPPRDNEENTRSKTSRKTVKNTAATKIHKPFSSYRRAAITATTKTAAWITSLNPAGTK